MSLTVSHCTQTRFDPGPINQSLPPTSDSSYPQLHSHLRNKARITKNTKCTAFDNTKFISTWLFCAVYTEETGLESYKVSLTEPMHDLKNLIIHLYLSNEHLNQNQSHYLQALMKSSGLMRKWIYKAKHGSVKRISEAHENDNVKYLSFLSQQYSSLIGLVAKLRKKARTGRAASMKWSHTGDY